MKPDISSGTEPTIKDEALWDVKPDNLDFEPVSDPGYYGNA